MSISSIPSYFPYSSPASLPLPTLVPTPSRSKQYSTPSVCSNSCSSSVFSLEECVSSLAPSAASSTTIPSLSTSCFEDERSHGRVVPFQRSLQNFQRNASQDYNGSHLLPSDEDHGKVLPKNQRQNPRRSVRLLANHTDNPPASSASQGLALLPPPLLRQSERKLNFVDGLVDTAAQIVEAIWPLTTNPCSPSKTSERIIPLRLFIQETLRRSRTSYSTLQVALYYLILLRPHIDVCSHARIDPPKSHTNKSLHCGRRMFLAALIIASKYLQDRNYSARAWSKISGLNIAEINVNELAFLNAVNWKLHISDAIFEKWTNLVLKFTPTSLAPGLSPGSSQSNDKTQFNRLISSLTPDIEVAGDLELAKLYGVAEKRDHCPSGGQLRMQSKAPFLCASPNRTNCERNNFGFVNEEPNASVALCGLSVDYQSPLTTEPQSPGIIIYRGREPMPKRVFETLRQKPRSNDKPDSDSDLSSSPESTCSIFSKTSRSSSISSVSSKRSPVVTNLCSKSVVASVSSGQVSKRPLYQPCTRLLAACPSLVGKINCSISDVSSKSCALLIEKSPSSFPSYPGQSKCNTRGRTYTIPCSSIKHTNSKETASLSLYGSVEDKPPRFKRIKCRSTERDLVES